MIGECVCYVGMCPKLSVCHDILISFSYRVSGEMLCIKNMVCKIDGLYTVERPSRLFSRCAGWEGECYIVMVGTNVFDLCTVTVTVRR